MGILKIRYLIVILFLGSSLVVQATTLKTLERFDSLIGLVYLQNDWNPNDGDTHWEAIGRGGMLDTSNPLLIDFYGQSASGTFTVGDDQWETVSIKSRAEAQFDLEGTQEIQLAIRPRYVTNKKTVSVLLRLTMQDGSIWDQTKVILNNRWQTTAFPVTNGSFSRATWGVSGVFDLKQLTAWEIILVDLPMGYHAVDFYALYAKGNYNVPIENVAEPFGVNFFTTRGAAGEENILFRHNDWNPSDGDTQWLSHLHRIAMRHDPYSYLKAFYRSEGDPWETVSLRKEAQTYFDLSDKSQILTTLSAPINSDPNALVMSLTMEDGSVWQQGQAMDIVQEQAFRHYSQSNEATSPYRFALDSTGVGWTQAIWSPEGIFDLSRIKTWELYFNNLKQGIHPILFSKIKLMEKASLLRDENNTFHSTGNAYWINHKLANDGLIADISSSGDADDSISIVSENPVTVNIGFNLEVSTNFQDPLSNAVIFKLTTNDGKVWQKNYGLQGAGRNIFRIYVTCPSPYPQQARPDPGDYRCKGKLNNFYGIDPTAIVKWEIILNHPPIGEHKVGITLIPEIQ